MNEWGIPDWNDPDAYGDTESWHLWRWRWEFFRRRDDLRKDCTDHADEHYRDLLKLSEAIDVPNYTKETILKPGHPRFKVSAPGCDGKYGYPTLPHPAYGDHPLIDICPIRDRDEDVGLFRGEYSLDETATIRIQSNELAVVFKLDKPIAPQLKAAKEELVRNQRQRSQDGRTVRKHRHPEKWLDYLRTLDARDADPGATWREFTESLYAHGLVERRKDLAGGYCDPPPQAGRDKWEAADALRFNF